MQMRMDTNEPVAVAKPMGNKVRGYQREARYTRGIRAVTMETTLCRNEISERPQAQKYPLKQKWTPAKMQSKI